MSIHYTVQFFDVLTEADATGFIDTPVVTLAAETALPTVSFTNDNGLLCLALMVRTNGTPMVAHVVIVSEHDGNEVRLVRRYLIGDPGLCVAVRFTSTAPHGLISKACVLHDLNDDLALYDLGRTAAN